MSGLRRRCCRQCGSKFGSACILIPEGRREREERRQGGKEGREGGQERTFEDVEHPRHLTENQHPVSLLLELLQQFICKDGNKCNIGIY